jgi:hypothetical protein
MSTKKIATIKLIFGQEVRKAFAKTLTQVIE